MGTGRIITFYSYKGGTGRSMLLANVAWILASNAKKVLVLDWDLEAPGLHRYFAPFLADRDLTASDGLIDFVLKFATAAAAPVSQQNDTASEEPWYAPYANVLRYATSLRWDFGKPGTIDFIPAGRQGPSYSTRVNSFNWQLFYERLGGGTLLELAKDRMRAEYDYILIDSRTGVSDTSGICTVQMPDALVVCFTLNNQSLEGAAAVAASVYEQRTHAKREIQIFPVAMRLENAEKQKLRTRRDLARERFSLFPNSLPSAKHDRYWGDVPVQYEPYYAYEEILAAFGDNPADRVSILASCQQITSYLTDGEVSRLVPAPEPERLRVLREFEGTTAAGAVQEQERLAESTFVRFSMEAQAVVRRLMLRLIRIPQEDEIGGERLVQVPVEECGAGVDIVIAPLIGAGLLVKGVDSRGRETLRLADASLLETWPRLRSWINEDQRFLLWRQQIQDAVHRWEAGGRDPSWLLSEGARKEAADWGTRRADDLNSLETAYIASSLLQAPPTPPPPPPKESWLRLSRAPLVAAVVAVVLLMLSMIFPTGRVFVSETSYLSQSVWVLSQDRSVAVSFVPGEESRIWMTDKPWREAQKTALPFSSLQASPRGLYLAGLSANRIFVWPSQSRFPAGAEPTLPLGSGWLDFGFSPDERWCYALSGDGDFFFWSPADPEPPQKPVLKVGWDRLMWSVAFSPDGRYFGIASTDGLLRVGRTEDTSVDPVTFSSPWPQKFFYSNDSRWLAFFSSDAPLSWVDLTHFPRASALPAIEGMAKMDESIFEAKFTPDNRWVVARQSTGDLFAGAVGKKLKRLTDNPTVEIDSSLVLEIDPTGRWAVAATHDGAVYVWQLGEIFPSSPTLLADSASRDNLSASFSPRGDWLAVSLGGIVYVLETGEKSRTEVARLAEQVTFRWASDGRHLFTFAGNEVFFGEAGKELERIWSERSPIQEILVSPDGEELIVLGERTISFVKRRFLFWDVPVHTFKWPSLAPVL